MVRFIFLCMAVVALSFVSIGAQYLINDMKDEHAAILARNAQTPLQEAPVLSASIEEDSFSPESLNQIETAAGAFSQEDAGFGESFTNVAPKALADEEPQAAIPFTPTSSLAIE